MALDIIIVPNEWACAVYLFFILVVRELIASLYAIVHRPAILHYLFIWSVFFCALWLLIFKTDVPIAGFYGEL